MEEELKKLLRDMKENENTRKNAISEINAEMSRIDLREETETERFIGTKDEEGNLRKDGGIYNDINAGLYNHITDGQMQKIIDEELKKIKEKYDTQRSELNNKLDETEKQQEKEKANDYKKISSAIKEYHLDMALKVNKANSALVSLETERNEKLKELDEKIAKKEAEQTHMIIKNRNFMDIEDTQASVDIRVLGQDIEELKAARGTLDKEYRSKLEAQSNTVKYYSEQKERAGKFLGSIILSDKSIDEIYELLFNKEIEKESGQKAEEEQTKNDVSAHQNHTTAETSEQEKHTTAETSEQKNQTPTTADDDFRFDDRPLEDRSDHRSIKYEFSFKNGIEYDGQHIDTNTLLNWYDERKKSVDYALKEVLGDKEYIDDFLDSSDKLIYLSIIYKDPKEINNGKITLSPSARQRLETYYDMWEKPEDPENQKNSNMRIIYDLRGMSKIQRFFRRNMLSEKDVLNMRNTAFSLRNRKDVSIKKGPITALLFKAWDRMENAEKVKQIEESREDRSTETRQEDDPHEKFVDRLNPSNPEYTQVDNAQENTETTREEAGNSERE